MAERDLTQRQHEVYRRLVDRHRAGAPPPSLTELCEGLGVRSRGSMHKHVQALVAADLVEPMEHRQRGVHLTARALAGSEGLPLLGRIAAGRPIEAIETPEHIEVPAWLRGRGECYVLEVEGDSMVEDGILDGDWVVIERRNTARNGEVVVALIDESEATLKRIEQKQGQCVLIPANRRLAPMTYHPDRVRIQGIVIGQLRSYR